MRTDFTYNRAEDLFHNNIGHIILVKLIGRNNKKNIFKGRLMKVICNTFLIETSENGCVEMFRYEDVEYLKLIK